MKAIDPLRNPKDPLHHQPDAERELFRELGKLMHGYSLQQVADVAANLLINAVRQSHDTKGKAEESFNRIVTKAREVLLDKHYDAMGKRRSVYPFDQTINMPLADLRDKH